MKPVRIIFPNPIETGLVVSSIGLKWNISKKRSVDTEYQFLIDHLGENLPFDRKYQGGFFFAQVHSGKMIPWDITDTDDLAVVIYSASKRPNDICVRNLRITVGDFAGHEMGSALLNGFSFEKVLKR